MMSITSATPSTFWWAFIRNTARETGRGFDWLQSSKTVCQIILCVNGELHKAPLAVQMRTELDVFFFFFSILYCKSIWRTGRLE